MSQPTPRQAVPADVRRQEAVAETMAGLADVDLLPLPEAAAALTEAQRVLSAVLSNDPSVTQPGFPGLGQ